MAISLKALRPVWANPVVSRDIRVRMRGARSYWNLAAYLLLLGLLSVSGYDSSTKSDGPGGLSVVDAQSHLKAFYGFIFMTLASLLCLIAPALTAASITTERQRLTLELLVSSPMTAMELLIGKLISSTAYLVLLLALSLPASALCVMLGGATIGDVGQVYLLLVIDSLVLAAIGLYYSCALRASLPAMFWTYFAVGGLLLFSSIYLVGRLTYTMFSGRSYGDASLPLLVLNPFAAVAYGPRPFDLFGHQFPTWIGTSVAAFLIIRVLVTAAAYRLGNYGGNPAGSLRRQLLLLTAIAAGLVSYAAGAGVGSAVHVPGGMSFVGAPPSAEMETLVISLVCVFIAASPFLTGLFVPVVAEDAPRGTVVEGRYNLRKAFRPEHAGALPFYHVWLFTLVGAVLLGIWAAGGKPLAVTEPIVSAAFYLSGLGFFLWSLARRVGGWVSVQSSARSMTFTVSLLFALAPMMLAGILNTPEFDWNRSKLLYGAILYPLIRPRDVDLSQALLISTGVCYLYGILIYPFWGNVTPGGRASKG